MAEISLTQFRLIPDLRTVSSSGTETLAAKLSHLACRWIRLVRTDWHR